MNFQELENNFGLSIPTEFKLFYKLIENSNPFFEYYDQSEDFCFRLSKWIKIGISDVKIDSFYSFESLKLSWEKFKGMNGLHLKFLPFGMLSNPHNGQLLFCIDRNNFCEIFYKESEDINPIFLCSNLFDLFRSMRVELRTDKSINTDQLYKNWNENFWRVRDDE